MPYLSATAPTLVIAPFQTQGDRESNCLAEGLREVLSVELGGGRGLAVRMAPNRYPPIARGPGGRYCLTGRVTQVAGRVRVTIRLVDTEDQRHVWGDTFDGFAHDALALQDQVTGNDLLRPTYRLLPRTPRLRWSPEFGQVVKLGSPFGEDGPDGGQAEAVFG